MEIGSFPIICQSKSMPLIECGWAPIGALVRQVLRESAGPGCLKDLRSVIHELRVRITCAQHQSRVELSLNLKLRGIVLRVARVGYDVNKAKVRIWICVPHRGIEILNSEKVRALCSDVGHREDEAQRQLPLHVDVPLLSQRVMQIAGHAYQCQLR